MRFKTLFFSLLLAPIAYSQVNVIAYFNPDTTSVVRYKTPAGADKALIKMKPGDFQFLNPAVLKQLNGQTIQKVELVYTDWPPGEDMRELNRKRFVELYQHLPHAFASKVVEWKLIKQTGVKSTAQLGSYFHGFVVHYRPLPPFTSERQTVMNIIEGTGEIDSTCFKVFERNKSWKNMLVVCDVTGSMSPYVGELMLWLKLHGVNKLGKNFVFFNDDEEISDPRAQDPFGHWHISTKDYQKLMETMFAAMKQGKHRETNLEAMLYALDKFDDQPKGIVLIADNWESPHDMNLLSLLVRKRIPVHVIVCGVNEKFNMNYFQIAKATGGSIHTVEDDIFDLAKLADGKQFKLGSYSFVARNGYISQLP